MKINMINCVLTSFFIFILSFNQTAYSKEQPEKQLKGNSSFYETIYVPVYSSIFYGDRQSEFKLAVTLSIRNTSLKNSFILTTVDYYSTSGKLLKKFLLGKRKVNPLETISFTIKESDNSGGSGANFIVKCQSDKKANFPLVEAIMIGTGGQQGISFTSRGIVIDNSY